MYYITKNNVITLNRGDYLKLPVQITTGEFPYKTKWVLDEGDSVFFGLMQPNQIFERAFLKKELTKRDEDEFGDLYVEILPEDTINLLPGTYYYEIKAVFEDKGIARIDTLVQKTKFIILD